VGITEEELETCFADYLEAGAAKLQISRTALLDRIRDYYDGFSFDGRRSITSWR
jgi:hypothetical protein